MAVTIISQPVGHKLTEAELTAVVNPSGDDALFTTTFAHGLSDGDWVYIQSVIESYNGYKYVDQTAYNSFKLKNSVNGDYVEFKQAISVTYRVSVLDHGWQCVHLPIVYELYSDLSPINVPDTPRTITNQSNNNGYTQIVVSPDLFAPEELAWIQLTGEGPLAGIYQIVTVVSFSTIVINLAYDSSNIFAEYTLLNYYNNYCVNVAVYAGIPPGHRWEEEKPFEVAATLKLIPDSEGFVKFSISDILRGYINLRNNLALDTLPNNLDFFVGFYIAYWESYDQSNGTEITTYTGTETEDGFDGFAVNAKLPFKSETVSALSDYVSEDVYLAQWLTIQTNPIAVVGRFFDISFILMYSGVDVRVLQNGVLIQTITNPGLGIIRVPLEFETAGEVCIQATTAGAPEIPGSTSAMVLPSISSGVNIAGPYVDWIIAMDAAAALSGTLNKRSDVWANLYSFVQGNSYTITPDIDYVVGASEIEARIYFVVLDSLNNILISDPSAAFSVSGTYVDPTTFTAPFGATKYGYFVTTFSVLSSTTTFFIRGTTGTVTTQSIPAIPAQTLTEEICITVLEECDDTLTPVEDDEIRLTEDGDFRILE